MIVSAADNNSSNDENNYDQTEPLPVYPRDCGRQLCATNLTVDYIVCGAGTAGSIVAARLSENKNSTVILLEAGHDPPAYSYISSEWQRLVNNTELDYHYRSERNRDYFQGLENNVAVIPAGKAVGGSHAINGQQYFTPTEQEMNEWQTTAGCSGWNYSESKRYTIKSENYHDNRRFSRRYHGSEGYQDVTQYRSNDPDIRVFETAFSQMGLPFADDLNRGKSIEYGNADGTTAHGVRVSTAKGYLSTAAAGLRRNLCLARGTLVRKVVVDVDVKPLRAVGVEITAPNGRSTCIVRARREVVLSLGAIRSPQILLLSGIGPREHLREMGIPVIADLPVGQNYKDHAFFNGNIFARTDDDDNSDRSIKSPSDYFNEGVASAGITQLNAFFNSYHVKAERNNMQIQIVKYAKGSLSKTANRSDPFGINEEIRNLLARINDQAELIQLNLILVDVKSRGNVTLKSLNPTVHPRIQTNLLNDEADLKAMVRGLRWIRELARTSAIRKSGYELKRIDYPACRNYSDDDRYYVCALKQIATTYSHSQSTVKMGGENQKDAPLTPHLTVKGFQNLAVVDASVIPLTTTRNSNPTVIMLAEKASDIIKDRNNNMKD